MIEYDMIGPRGVIESAEGSPDAEAFRSRPDTAYPLALVLADLCGLQGAEIRHVAGVDPAGLTALAVSADGGTVVMLGNLTRDAQHVRVRLAGADLTGTRSGVRLRLLDQHTVERATMDPHGFLRGGEDQAVSGGTRP